MLWHCASRPVRLADLCSDLEDIRETCFDDLLDDYRISKDACEKAANTVTSRTLVEGSPFNTRVVREIVSMLTADHETTMADRKALVIRYAKMIFASWGQTKICEDSFKELRDREQRDTCNQNISVTSYYAMMSNMGTIKAHKRNEPQPGHDEPQADITAKDAFLCKEACH